MLSSYSLLAVASLGFGLLFVQTIVKWLRSRSIAHLPGPESTSWWVGNLRALLCPDIAGEAELKWSRQYGTAVHFKGSMGADVLLTSDPKAMQYIMNTAGYSFPKPQQLRTTIKVIFGTSLSSIDGPRHARQRKLMNPAFSYSSLRVLLPLFHDTAERTSEKWKEIITKAGGSTVLDISSWMGRTTLDALGEAAFDYKFGAIEEAHNPLSEVYAGLISKTFYRRSNTTIVFEALWGYLPFWIVKLLHTYPTKRLYRLRKYVEVARGVAKDVIDRQTHSHVTGKQGGKDAMSILIKANLSEDPKTRLTEYDIISQLMTFMFAGHETTAYTITWALYEMSRNKEYQTLIRDEIKATRAEAEQRGDKELSAADLDSMVYLLALIKETLRLHPIVTSLHREAGREDIIPLSDPVTAKTGEVITAIPVSKGQAIMISVAAYNRLKSVWGDDADVFRPERFLGESSSGQHKTTLGVLANIATFSSGFRSCLGWRFAMFEMQAIIIKLSENFELSHAPGDPAVVSGSNGLIVTPMLAHEPGRTQLPLTVSMAA